MTNNFAKREKVIVATFYASAAGNQPVRDWLRSAGLTDGCRKEIGADIHRVECEWPEVGQPLVGAMKGGLWEVRSRLPTKRISRILFGVEDGLMVVLHGFIKKTAQTPAEDLKLASRRWADWKKNNP